MQVVLRSFVVVIVVSILGVSVAGGGNTDPLATPAISAACGFGVAGYGWWPWGLYTREYIPYHAMHPPVYYSYPVPRTYGYSPFAYPPGTLTPGLAAPDPEVVPNPHVPPKDAVKPTATRVAGAPLRIRNPYVEQENKGGLQDAALSAFQGRPPLVVFPARMTERQ